MAITSFSSRFGFLALSAAAAATVMWAAALPCAAQQTTRVIPAPPPAEETSGAGASREHAAPAANARSPFTGIFKSKRLTLQLHLVSGGGGRAVDGMYVGTLSIDGNDYLVTANQDGNSLKGTFGAINARAAERYALTAVVSGDTLTLTSDNQQFVLSREAAAKPNPLTAPPKVGNAEAGRGSKIEIVIPGGDDEAGSDGTVIFRPIDPGAGPVVVTTRGQKPPAREGTPDTTVTTAQPSEFAVNVKRLRQTAIAKHDGRAAVQLGDLFAKGSGQVKPDLVEACTWYTVADSLDEASAAAKNEALAPRMTDQQLEEVDTRVAAIMRQLAPTQLTEGAHGPIGGGDLDHGGIVVIRPPTGGEGNLQLPGGNGNGGTGKGTGGPIPPPIGDKLPPPYDGGGKIIPPPPPITGEGRPTNPVTQDKPGTTGPVVLPTEPVIGGRLDENEPRLPGPRGE
jgi:hypothetical protein